MIAAAALACAAVIGTHAGAAGGDEAVIAARARGAYAEAEQAARGRLDDSQREHGATSAEAARSLTLLLLALVDNGHAGRPEAVDLSARLLSLADIQADVADQAAALDAVAYVHAARGEYEQAVPLYQRAVGIQASRGDDVAMAGTLEHLSDSLLALERFDDAAAALASAMRIRRRRAETDPIGVADVEGRFALMYRLRGDLAAADQHVISALDPRVRLTPTHPGIAALQQLRGDIQYLSGNVSAARDTYQRSVEVATKLLGEQHPLTAMYLRKLAGAEWTLGDAAKARAHWRLALTIADSTLAPCHPELSNIENDLAVSDLDQGEYSAARVLFERARRQYEKCLGPTHSLVGTVIYNLATVANATGDLAEAERLLNGAIRIWSSAASPNHQFISRAQDLLADVILQRGFPRRALAMHEQVLAARRKAPDSNDVTVARTLAKMAYTAQVLGDSRLALRYADDAEKLYISAGTSDDAAPLASLVALRGEVERSRGNRAVAEQQLERAAEVRVRRFGERHPIVASLRASLALVDLESGNLDRATDRALQAEDVGRSLLQFTIRELSERQALAFADSRPKGLGVALSVAAVNPDAGGAPIYDAVIRSRAVVLDELAARSHAIDSTGAAGASLQNTMSAARQRYANLMLRTIQNAGSVPADRLEQARIEKEQAERAVAEQSAEAREELARSTAGLEQVRAALPAGSALVSFVKYDRTRRPAKPTAPPLPLLPSYAAFVMTGGASGQLAFVPLGSASTIEPMIRAWRGAVLAGAGATDGAAAEARYRDAALPLRRAVWDPIAHRLAGASRVYIVPDGQLNLVNFASLPATRGYLVESALTIHYLSTERDLLVDVPRSGSMTALVVGRPSFGGGARPAVGTAGNRDGCLGAGGWQFGDLPGTGQEAADISRVWSRAGGDVTLLTGAGATKSAFKQSAASRRVVHLATHGFFLGAGCAPAATRTRSVGGLVSAADVPTVQRTSSDNPLLLSGLALAGANRRVGKNTDQDNGILTAEEIAGLDLRGTEWAVLSACDTGLGEIRSGEGVFGLRRAFQIAGARTVIMSLWSVDDVATRAWMRSLYEGRLMRKLDTADAVKQASLVVLKQRRAAAQSTHPFYWAAFVAAGDWR